MNINRIIISEIKKILGEEFIDGNLYGYHVTSCNNVKSIYDNGFKVGSREMEGKGIYGFFDLETAIRYGKKDINDFCIIKFIIPEYNLLFIVAPRIAKQVFGNRYRLQDQIEDKYNVLGGLKYFYEEFVLKVDPSLSYDDFLQKLDEAFIDYSPANQNIFVFDLIPSSLKALKGGYIKDSEYGLQFLIRYPHRVLPISYYRVSFKDEIGDVIKTEKKM